LFVNQKSLLKKQAFFVVKKLHVSEI